MSLNEESTPLIKGGEYQNVGFFHPTRAFYRWSILFVISLICFGSYFTYDEIEPRDYINTFHGYISNSTTSIDPKFTLLYSVYSIPNTVLVFFGGIIGDKIGLRIAGTIFVTLCVFGAALVALGVQLIGMYGITPADGYIITIIGRVVFGCGAESLNVIQNAMISRWFAGGRELAFAMGLVLSISRLGDFLALAVTHSIAEYLGSYIYVLWIGCGLCALSFLAVMLYSIMDRTTEKYFPGRVVDPEENTLNFKAVPGFDLRFWLIAVICMSYYGGIFPFVAICNDYLSDTYKITNGNEVSLLSSFITLASMILSPFLGKFLDTVAMRPYFVLIGSFVVIPSHIWLAFVLPYPAIPIVAMGLSFSLVPSALWPSVPLVIKPKEVATAFGVMAAIQNTGLAIINALSGKITNSHLGNQGAMWFFVLLDCIGLLFAILLVIVDRRRGRVLINRRPKLEEPTTIQ